RGVRTPVSAMIDLERENARLAFLRSAERGKLEDVRKAVESLFYFYDTNAWYQAGFEVFHRAGEILGQGIEEASENHLRLWAWVRTFEASFLQPFARYDEVESLLNDSLKVLRSFPPSIEMVFTLWRLSSLARRYDNPSQPIAYLRDMVALA